LLSTDITLSDYSGQLLGGVGGHSGRRLAIIFFLIVITLGLLLTAFTSQVSELIIASLVTGLGIGGKLIETI